MAEKKRKSLTQRVADRKKGIPDDEYDAGKKKSKYGKYYLLGMILQGVGLIVLMILMGGYIRGGYDQMNWILVIISSTAFITGRILTSAKKFFF